MSKASKNDKIDNKPDYSLIPKVFVDQVAYVMMAGAQKYGRFNYTKGHNMSQLISAAERHIKQLQDGEDIDRDTSDRVGVDIEHAACVCANMLMLLHQKQLGTLNDDRFRLDTRPAVAPLSDAMKTKLGPTVLGQEDVATVEISEKGRGIGGTYREYRHLQKVPVDKLAQFLADTPNARVISTGSGSYFKGGKL